MNKTMKKFPIYLTFLFFLTNVSCTRSALRSDTSHLQGDTQIVAEDSDMIEKNIMGEARSQKMPDQTDELYDELLDSNTPIGNPPISLVFINGERIRDNLPDDPFENGEIQEIPIEELKAFLKRRNYILDDVKILKDDESLKKYRKGGYVASGAEKWIKIVYEIKAHPINEKGEIFEVVRYMPQFPDGNYQALLAFIEKNIHRPEKMFQDGVHGEVVVECIIEKDGSIEEYGIANNLLKDKSGNPCPNSTIKKLCDQEAWRIFKMMPKWIPGKNVKGEAVRVRCNIPISFNENSNKINKFQRYED